MLIGFVATPTGAFACGAKSENIESTCNEQPNSEMQNKGCCDTEKGQCGHSGKDCDGKCGNPSCNCPSNSSNCPYFVVLFFAQFSQVGLILSKPNFYYQDTYYSSGFHSIWLPPKIG